VSLIAALCDILGCSSDDLLDLPTPAAPATTQTGSGQPTARTADTPVDGTDARGTDVRQRLLTAMADCIDDLGYPQTTVAHVVARARASRRTFYQVFTDREDCFIALLTQANHDIIAAITDAVDPTAFWQIQVRQAIEAWVASAQSRPALMLAWIRDVPTLAASTRRLQNEAMEAFIVMLQTLSNTGELRAHGITPVSRQRAIMIIGGLRELTAMTVESGGHLADITDEAVAACIALGPTPDTSD
jgi:AcrR family transcriptional regulator